MYVLPENLERLTLMLVWQVSVQVLFNQTDLPSHRQAGTCSKGIYRASHAILIALSSHFWKVNGNTNG